MLILHMTVGKQSLQSGHLRLQLAQLLAPNSTPPPFAHHLRSQPSARLRRQRASGRLCRRGAQGPKIRRPDRPIRFSTIRCGNIWSLWSQRPGAHQFSCLVASRPKRAKLALDHGFTVEFQAQFKLETPAESLRHIRARLRGGSCYVILLQWFSFNFDSDICTCLVFLLWQ